MRLARQHLARALPRPAQQTRKIHAGTSTRARAAFSSGKSEAVEPQRTGGVLTLLRKWLPRGNTPKNPATLATGRIDEVGAGLQTADAWKDQDGPSDATPVFEIVNPGISALVLAKLPAGASIFAQVGAAVGRGPLASGRLILNGGPANAPLRRLGGAQLLLEELTSRGGASDVLLSPGPLSDVALLELAGDAAGEYAVRADALLALTRHVQLGTRWRHAAGWLDYVVSGAGSVAISGYGGVYRLCLAPRETFLVASDQLLAYDTRVRVSQAFTFSHGDEALPGAPWRQRSLQDAWRATSRYAMHALRRLAGRRRMHRLEGPGDFYISARAVPRFDSLAALGSIRAHLVMAPTGLDLGKAAESSQADKEKASMHEPGSVEQARAPLLGTDSLQATAIPPGIVHAARSVDRKQR